MRIYCHIARGRAPVVVSFDITEAFTVGDLTDLICSRHRGLLPPELQNGGVTLADDRGGILAPDEYAALRCREDL